MDGQDVLVQMEKRQEIQVRESKRRARDWRALLASGSGKRVLSEIVFGVCGAMTPPIPWQSDFDNGMRAAGLRIFEIAGGFNAEACVGMFQESVNGGRDDDRSDDREE